MNARALVYRLGCEMLAQGITTCGLSRRSELSDGTVARWVQQYTTGSTKTAPRLDTFEQALNALGFELVIRKKRDMVAPRDRPTRAGGNPLKFHADGAG